MQLKAVAVVLAVAGLGTSVAIAKGPPVSVPEATGADVRICHRTGPARKQFRSVSVARSSLETHLRHGDLLASSGGCPATRFAAP